MSDPVDCPNCGDSFAALVAPGDAVDDVLPSSKTYAKMCLIGTTSDVNPGYKVVHDE